MNVKGKQLNEGADRDLLKHIQGGILGKWNPNK